MNMEYGIVCFALLIALVACNSAKTELHATTISISSQMSSNDTRPLGIEWASTGIFVLYSNGQLYHLSDVLDTSWEMKNLPQRSECRRTSYNQLAILGNGNFALLQICVRTQNTHEIITYNWETGASSNFTTYSLPKNGNFSFSQNMATPIFQTARAFGTLYWIEKERLLPIPITLTDGSKTWFLPDTPNVEAQWEADPIRVDKREYKVGMIENADWSPNGDFIAIMATLEPLGQPLATLGRYSWHLYLVNPETLETSILVENITDGVFNAWSPDGQWIAYKEGAQGLWLVNVTTKQKERIYSQQTGAVAWSPDGKNLLVTDCANTACDTYQLVIVDVSTIVN